MPMLVRDTSRVMFSYQTMDVITIKNRLIGLQALNPNG